jgi:hypothetical protein
MSTENGKWMWTAALAIVVGGLFAARPTSAAVIASDDASDSAYDDGLDDGDNGGFGFTAWNRFPDANGANSGWFVGSSANNGDGDGNADNDIDTAGEAWGVYASNSNLADAFRGFQQSLQVGWTFSIAMDNGFIDSGGSVGFGLRTAGGADRLEFFFGGGSSNYTLNDSAGVADSGIGFTDEGLDLVFLLTGADTYKLSVTTLGNGATTTFTGTLSSSGAITNVRLFNFNAGSGSSNDAFFNSLVITTPTPAALPGGLAIMGLSALRRRRG